MSVLDMKYIPDQLLTRKTRKVESVTPRIHRLVDDMLETMRFNNGIGLAANQVGAMHQVAVIQLDDWYEPVVLINPKLIKREGERYISEQCLSVPGYVGLVRRSEKVRVRATGLDGAEFRIRADGLYAQALEHEIGHLNGSVYIDHLVSPDKFYKIAHNDEC